MTFTKSMWILTLTLGMHGADVFAASRPVDTARLQKELTPVGAVRAGNSSGTIPAWTGGVMDAAVGWKRGDDRPDPYADEKPLFTITGDNANLYENRLSPGAIALLKRYPSFQMHVYRTHRTAAWPQHVYDNISLQANSARLVDEGNGVEGVWGAIPFPIPEKGIEVLWNHNLRYLGNSLNVPSALVTVVYDSDSRLEWEFENRIHYTYHDPNVDLEAQGEGVLIRYASTVHSPPRDAGEGHLVIGYLNARENRQKVWTYDPGERRARRAPNMVFDAPDRPMNVIDDYDMFSGSPERYTWKLLGKREMYVPYNNNGLNATTHEVEHVYQAPVINSSLVRYELHRVWVVEASLKPSESHIYHKRIFYFDEDTWSILATDKYAENGELWRVGFNFPVTAPEVPVTAGGFNVHYDLRTGGYYAVNGVSGQERAQTFDEAPPKATYFSPGALRRRGR